MLITKKLVIQADSAALSAYLAISYMVTSLRLKLCSWTNFAHYHKVLNGVNETFNNLNMC